MPWHRPSPVLEKNYKFTTCNLIFSSHTTGWMQEFRAFETTRACGTFHRVQASHPSVEKGAWGEEEWPPRATPENCQIRRWLYKREWRIIWFWVQQNNRATCSSWGCSAENEMHGNPFSGCNKKLNGLLSTRTIWHKSFVNKTDPWHVLKIPCDFTNFKKLQSN